MKNFLAILKKYTLAMVMNFTGLVLAFTAFIAIQSNPLPLQLWHSSIGGLPRLIRLTLCRRNKIEKKSLLLNNKNFQV